MTQRFGRRRFLGAAAAGHVARFFFRIGRYGRPARSAARVPSSEGVGGSEGRRARRSFSRWGPSSGTACTTSSESMPSRRTPCACGRPSKGGGVVSPPLFGGVGGLSEPHTFIMDPEDDVFSRLLRPWLEQLCREMARDGFRAIIILTGHYGAAQQIVVRETAVRMSRALGIPVLGTPEYWLALDVGYTGDHAAWGETSLMMHLFPDTVDLSRLGKPPYQGVGGRDPKESSAEDGRRITETIVSRLATLAQKMPDLEPRDPGSFRRRRGGSRGQAALRPERQETQRLDRLAQRGDCHARLRQATWPKNASTRSKPPWRSCNRCSDAVRPYGHLHGARLPVTTHGRDAHATAPIPGRPS